MAKEYKRFTIYFFILAVFQFFHSTEEVIFRLEDWMPIVSGKIHNIISLVPTINFPEQSFIVTNLLIVIFLFVFSVFVFREFIWALKLAKIISVVEIINGAGHITNAIIFLKYFPGCVSGIGLIIFGLLCLKNYRNKI